MSAHITLAPLGDPSLTATADPSSPDGSCDRLSVIVTGIPSDGKGRLVSALSARFRALALDVDVRTDSPTAGVIVRVHAETDLEGLVESDLSRGGSDVVAPVDWETTERSVARVIDHLVAQRLVPAERR